MKSVLVIGSCVLDVFHHNEKFSCVGGDAANQAILLNRLDCRPVLSSLVGEDDFIFIKKYLSDKGVNTSGLKSDNTYKTTVSHIYFDAEFDRSFKVSGGAHRHFKKENFDPTLLEHIDALSVASLFSMEDLEKDGLYEILELCHQRNILTFMDTSTDRNHIGLDGFKRFLPLIDYFIPGYDEISASIGIRNINDIISCLHKNGARNIILKCGKSGAVISDGSFICNIPAFSFPVKDTSGCGDCFCAAFISSVLHGLSLKESCRNACFVGSLNTRFTGTHNIDIDYERMIDRDAKIEKKR